MLTNKIETISIQYSTLQLKRTITNIRILGIDSRVEIIKHDLTTESLAFQGGDELCRNPPYL